MDDEASIDLTQIGESRGRHFHPFMAFFVFSTYGARGDILPYVAIGKVLKQRGHRVLIATSKAFRREVELHGLEWREAAPPDPTPEQQKRMEHPRFGTEFLLRELVVKNLEQNVAQLREAVQGADVLVTHTVSFAGPIVAELEKSRGLKWVSGVVSPLALLTNDVALAGSPAFANMPLVNFAVLSTLRRQYGRFFRPVQKLRAKLGLPRGRNPLWNEAHSELLQLCLWPEKFAWSYTHLNRVYCGFPFLESEEKIAPDIEAFLNAGEAPIVFVGASYLDVGEWAAQSVAAATQLKKRALLLGGPDFAAGNEVLMRPFANLQPIFERAKVIVHRGGIGTLALAMRSGKPVAISPVCHDQPDNARRARRLGLAQIAAGYNARSLTEAIEYCLSKEDYIYTCEMFGPPTAAENGEIVAADELENISRST